MFPSKRNIEIPGIDKTVNRISSGTVVLGDIISETDLRIDGRVTGNVSSKAKVIIGANGEVTGDLECREAAIEGKIKGNIHVDGLLRINSTSRVDGDIHYKKIIIEEGAVIIGELKTQSAISVQINPEVSAKQLKDVNKKLG